MQEPYPSDDLPFPSYDVGFICQNSDVKRKSHDKKYQGSEAQTENQTCSSGLESFRYKDDRTTEGGEFVVAFPEGGEAVFEIG